jgi:hypothetical protein
MITDTFFSPLSGKSIAYRLAGQAIKLVSAPPTFISATTQPQVEDFQNENKKLGSDCQYAMRFLRHSSELGCRS